MSARISSPRRDGNFRLEVADFGPIRRGSVELRPLTVFAGPSNTGKSYLATLVYALHQCFGRSYLPASHSRRPVYSFIVPMLQSLPNHDGVAMQVADWFAGGSETGLAPLPAQLITALRPALEQVPGADQYLEQELRRCFGVDTLDDLVRRGSHEDSATITLHIPQELGSDRSRYRVGFGPERVTVSGQVASLPRLSSEVFEDRQLFPGFVNLDEVPRLLSSLLDSLFQALIRPLIRNAYYLPADRTGVMHMHQLVISALIGQATTAGPRPPAGAPSMLGALADFLDGLIGISQLERRSTHRLSDSLEQNLLAGVIRLLRAETGYPSFAYQPANWDTAFPLVRTSSMVAEIASVVLYLRFLVQPGDLLIIEEPESHLHPDLQRKYVHELARLVQSGVRIMLITHSEWILEALANHVRLSELTEAERKGIAVDAVALSPHQVGAWLFKPSDEGGSIVDEISLDIEAGNFPAGFGDVTESLYNEWVGISNRIEATKADRRE